MKDQVTIFENAQFGRIRTSLTESGEPLFCLADLCKAINVANHRNVAKRIDQEGVRRMDILTQGGNQQVLLSLNPECMKYYFVLIQKRQNRFVNGFAVKFCQAYASRAATWLPDKTKRRNKSWHGR